MTAPHGVQLRRTKGWRIPPNTISVARPTRWGNEYRVDEIWLQASGPAYAFFTGMYDPSRTYQFDMPVDVDDRVRAEIAVQLYRGGIVSILGRVEHPEKLPPNDPLADEEIEIASALANLRGKNLACWCPLDAPCHRDVLLELANR